MADRDPSRQRTPTMDDVATRAGVSRALVSLVMRDAPNVSEHRRRNVLAAANELGYRPNAAARSLAGARSKLLGIVVDDLHNPFFVDVIDGVHSVAMGEGMRTLLNSSLRQEANEQHAIEQFLEHRVDGIILIGSRAPHSIIRAANAAVPIVSISVRVDEVDSLVVDDQRGSQLVVDQLVELGHRDIVHIDGGQGGGAELRRIGFLEAMASHGLVARMIGGDYTEKGGADAVDMLIAQRSLPSAIFAANDLMAVAALDRLQAHGVRVPQDVSVVGYDNTSLATLRHVSLTTIEQPRFDLGRRAAERVLERLAGDDGAAVHHTIEPRLVTRSTTGPAPASTPAS